MAFKIQLPIRTGIFQTANDPGGGGFKSPPTISKTIVSIFTISYMSILLGVLGMFQLKVQNFAILTILQKFQNKKERK